MKFAGQTLVNRRELIRNGLMAASGCMLGGRALGEGLSQTAAPAEAAGRTWTVGNDRMVRGLTFEPATGLVTEQLSGLAPHADFISPANLNRGMGQEFSFLCNGRRCAGRSTAFELVNVIEAANNSDLAIHLRHKELPLEVQVRYRTYSGHPVVRKHLVLHNTGTEPLTVSHLTIEALGISLGPANETTLLTQYGAVPRETFYTGRSEDAALLLASARTGSGLAVVSEVPGYMKRTEVEGFYDPDHLRIDVMYDTDLMPFERVLAPGETFATACASLAAFRRGDGLNDPHWVLPSYAAQVLERRVDAQGPPWIYNTWEPFHRDVNQALVLELVDAAAAMGMDIFTIDDGWQQEYGENAVNTAAFPQGLQPILDAVESKGMRLGLWVPLAAIGTQTAVYREHPEWGALDQEGKAKITGTAAGPKAVMCLASAYREAAAKRLIEVIERFHLAYVKIDLTTIFNAYGEAPGCWAKGHDHGTWAESLGRIYEGISYVTAKVYEKHPEVLLDLTFELWGQKHIIDAGLLAAGDLDWLSNVGDAQPGAAGPIEARQLLYQRAVSMPVEAMLIGNMHAEMPSIQERFATAIGAAPVLLGDLRKLSAADRQWYHEKTAWFKKLRRTTKISESFFPLGSWMQTSAAAWDGFARIARSGHGVVTLFRNKCDESEILVQLPLLPTGDYQVISVVTGADLGLRSHLDWARGVKVTFADAQPVEILEVTHIDG